MMVFWLFLGSGISAMRLEEDLISGDSLLGIFPQSLSSLSSLFSFSKIITLPIRYESFFHLLCIYQYLTHHTLSHSETLAQILIKRF